MSDDGCAYIFVDNAPEILKTYLNAQTPDEIIKTLKICRMSQKYLYNKLQLKMTLYSLLYPEITIFVSLKIAKM